MHTMKLKKTQVVNGVTYLLETHPNFVRTTKNGKNVTRLHGRIKVYVKQDSASKGAK